jgi:alpha-1,6-mannosyltransferase
VTGVSAGHLETVMLVLLLAAVLAERRHRPVLALVLSVAAGLVKAPALLLTVFLAVEHLSAAAPHRAARATAVRDGTAVAGALAVGTFLVPHGWGWIGTVVRTPASGRTLWTPSTAVAEALTALSRWCGFSLSLDRVLSATRLMGDVTALAVVILLLRRRGNYEARLGLALVAVSMLGVVLYPWYLLWGIPLLIVNARRGAASMLSLAGVIFATLYLCPEPREAAAAGVALVGKLGKAPPIGLLFALTVAAAAAQFVLWRRVIDTRAALAD